MDTNQENVSNANGEGSKENSQDTIVQDAEIKVGDIKDIQQSELVSISKDFNKIKAAEASVNSNFLFLRAGANALLSKKGSKRKPPPKKVSTRPAEKKDAEDKGPDSPKSDVSDERRSKPKIIEKSPFYCNVCEVELNSEATYMTHIEGRKHQKKLDTMNIALPRRARKTERLQYMKIKEGCRIPRMPKPNTEPHLKATFDEIMEPCLGLQFISEIWLYDDSMEDVYYCALCAITCGPNAIVSHIIGFKHRLAYMKLYDPVNYEDVKNLSTKKSELTAVLHAHAKLLEKRDGVGKVKVEEEIDDDFDYDDYGGALSEVPLNPKNLHFLPSALKMRFLQETVISCDRIPPYLTQRDVDSLNASLQNLKAAIARYSPLDNMLKKLILQTLEKSANTEKMKVDETEDWRNMPSTSTSRNEYMHNPGPGPVPEPMQGSYPDYMYDMPVRSSDPMPRDRFGQMPRNNYPMNTRQGAGYMDDSMDIPPFPYGNNQGNPPPQAYREMEMWGPITGRGGENRYDQYPRQGGQKRSFNEIGD